MKALFSRPGQDVLSIVKIFDIKASGSDFRYRRVAVHDASFLASFAKLSVNTRAHIVVSGCMVLIGSLRVDEAEDDGMSFCAEGESASDASPKEGSVVRCLLVLRMDMTETQQGRQPAPSYGNRE